MSRSPLPPRRSFRANRDHFHCILVDSGISPRAALAVEVLLASAFAAGGWLLASTGWAPLGLTACAGAAVAILVLRRRARIEQDGPQDEGRPASL